MDFENCKHGIISNFCCKCNYGNTGHHHESSDFDNPRDLVDELTKTSITKKLNNGYFNKED